MLARARKRSAIAVLAGLTLVACVAHDRLWQIIDSTFDAFSLSAARAENSPAAPHPLKLLKVEPVKGYAGDSFTITAEGFSPGAKIDFLWSTVDGSYTTKVMPDNVEYHERNYDEKRVSLGNATADAQGRVNARLTAPEDFGEEHDIYAVADGRDIGRGGFRILRSASIAPTEGPVGTPITISVKGLSWRGFEHFMALRYDNKYTGEISGVTTKCTAVFQIRAAGPAGKHIIQLNNSTATAPGAYLNTQQSPQDYIYAHIDNKQEFRFTFTVTKDNGPPADTVEAPESSRIARLNNAALRTTMSAKSSASASATLTPSTGPILSKTVLRANGLPVNADVGLFFVTARGNRMGPSGWNLQSIPLANALTKNDGTLSTTIEIPEDLGGWHSIKLIDRDQVLMEVPYYIEQRLAAIAPKRVKVGETFTIQIKGGGWTELDNTVAVTYDNASIGYACGFNTNGDITMNLLATGHPGTHLIDIYPAIYKGKDRVPLNYQTPFLTYARDFPALALGYRLPAYRLAIEVVE